MRQLLLVVLLLQAAPPVRAYVLPEEIAERNAPQPVQGWAGRRLSGPRLRAQLVESAPSRRYEAAVALRSSGEAQAAVRALATRLASERNERVRGAIAESLAFRGAGLEALIEAFSGTVSSGAPAVAQALASFEDARAVDTLIAGLFQGDRAAASFDALRTMGSFAVPTLRRVAREDGTAIVFELLGEIGDPSAFPELAAGAESSVPLPRRAALRALGVLGDDRARNIVRRATGHEDAESARIAWEALSRVAGPADVAPLEAGLAAGNESAPLLRALLRVAPERGAAAIVARVSGTDVDAAREAAEIALELPHPRLVPVLHGLVQEGSRRDEALSALAEVEGGAGLAVLLQLMPAPDVARALAICIRRWSPAGASRGLAALRQLPERGPGAARALMLRALARDRSSRPLLEARLGSDDPAIRGWAAAGLEMLGEASSEAVRRALDEERDPEAFRRLVDLSLAIGAPVDEGVIRSFASGRTAPASLRALRLASVARRDRARLRAALHSSWAPTVRAAVATLVATGDRAAVPALLALYDRDSNLRPYLARALGQLAGPGHQVAILARRRIAEGPLRRPWNGGSGRGNRVLRFRVDAEQMPTGVLCLITLPSGEMRLQRTLPSGELFLADLRAGTADVRPLIGP